MYCFMRTSWILLPLLLIASCAPGRTRDPRVGAERFEIEVESGSAARRWTPIECDLPGLRLPKRGGARALRAELVLDGHSLPAQVSRSRDGQAQLSFVLPKLEKEHACKLAVELRLRREAPQRFRWSEKPGQRMLYLDGKPVLSYEFAFDDSSKQSLEATKKVFHHVYGLHGEGPITKGPGGLYSHHRGLFLGFNSTRVGKRHFDFWHCVKGATVRAIGKIEGPLLKARGPLWAGDAERIAWVANGTERIVHEERRFQYWDLAKGVRLIDVHLRLSTNKDRVRLTGDPHHGGFQFRAAQFVAEHKDETRYLRNREARLRENDNWDDTRWAACRFRIGERSYLVAHFDHPSNPKPTTYSTRPYGRFGAFFDHVLKKGAPLSLRYRVLIVDPKLAPECCTQDFLEEQSRSFASAPKTRARALPNE